MHVVKETAMAWASSLEMDKPKQKPNSYDKRGDGDRAGYTFGNSFGSENFIG